jgi:hypothetical protein
MHNINTLKTQLNPICHLLALLAHPILHVSRIRVKHLSFAQYSWNVIWTAEFEGKKEMNQL